MCYASSFIKEQLEELKTKKDELQDECSTYDRLVSKLYHELESEDLENESGFNLTVTRILPPL